MNSRGLVGNLFHMADGRLSYLDFGMMGEIDRKTRQALIRATLHLVNSEFPSLAEDFVALGFLPPRADRSQIVPALTGNVFVQNTLSAQLNVTRGLHPFLCLVFHVLP